MDNSRILRSISNDNKYIQKDELPSNFVNIISLNNKLKTFMSKFINKYPNMFSRMISQDETFKTGGGKENEMDKIMTLYSNLDNTEVQKRVANIGTTLKEIQIEIDERSDGMKSFVYNMNDFTSKTLKFITMIEYMKTKIHNVNAYHSFKFNESDMEQLYVDRNIDQSNQGKSKIYANFLLDEDSGFMLNKMNILRYIVKSPIFDYHIDQVNGANDIKLDECVDMNNITLNKTCEGNVEKFNSEQQKYIDMKRKYNKFLYSYEHHIVLIMTINKNRHEGEIYRFIDKDILEEYLKLINDIKETTPKFYEKFNFTMDILAKFIHGLLSVINDRVIDIAMINSIVCKCNKEIKSELNYGFTLLNYFKILLETIIKNK